MRRVFDIATCSLLLGSKLQAQVPTVYLDTIYNIGYFGKIDNPNGSCLQLNDTSYVISCTAITPAFNYIPRLFAITLKGDTLWSRYYEDTLVGSGLSVGTIWDKYKNMITAGEFTVDSISYGNQAMLFKTDSDGDLQWRKTYGISQYGEYQSTTGSVPVATFDNYYLCIGQIGINNLNSDILVIRADSDGNEVARWQYGTPAYDVPYAGIQTLDSGFLFAGSTLYSAPPIYQSSYSIYIIKTDKNGKMLWDTIYSSPRDLTGVLLTDADANGVIEASDGYIICGHRYAQQNFAHPASPWAFQKAWIAKLNKQDGSIIWEQNIGVYHATYQRFYSITKTNDGGYAATGGYINADQVTGVCTLVKTDSQGDSLWSREFLYANDDSLTTVFYNILQTANNGYILTGYCEPSDAAEFPWVIITDSMGCLIPGCDTITAINSKATSTDKVGVALYPNPAGNVAYILIKSDDNVPDLSFNIYNTTGQLITTQTHATTDVTYVLNTGAFAKGMYLVDVMSGRKVVATKKFVKE
jgi:hypothetical protein